MEWFVLLIAFDAYHPEVPPRRIAYGTYETYEACNLAAKQLQRGTDIPATRRNRAKCLPKEWLDVPSFRAELTN